MAKVAFVTGCNGVSGNAIVEYLIRQPKEEWRRIVITSRSPLKSYWQDPRIDFVAIDFLAPLDEITGEMAGVCADVTHAFFTSYVHTDDFAALKLLNVPLFENFLTAIDTVAGSSLQRVCLQTGGKHYGAHLGPIEVPMVETLPRYEDDDLNFYYQQEDFMFNLHAQRSWSWNVIRPNGIVGFTPAKNGMSEAITLAIYILVCRELGQYPKFPGNKYFYEAVDDSSFAGGIAEMSVWASTNEHTKNEAFNHTNGDTYVWKYCFKKIGRYFNMDIPDQTEWPELGDKLGDGTRMAHSFRMADWARDKKPVWERVCEKYGGSKEAFDWGTWAFFDWTVGKAWPTLSSINKARSLGWTRQDDTIQSYLDTFKSFEHAGILPQNSRLHEELLTNPTEK
ncbi:hypothetical protein FE257_001836 [Aspergillus nanangensis]|uniref:PRISE-like Rossmann-fold domain-containing protein n=1 Tax=Aspergillus nanangensis TaxID=2582783 RepID=A0AAD4GPE9_ASPNN|nr:hypothetical protein FE257_001836 [Aspergillus nanangensis]